MTREFEYNGTKMPDPNPALTKEQAVAVLSAQFPELATAKIEPPDETTADGKTVQTFRLTTQAKTKG
jgi:PRTRC genetic system protein C